MEGISMNSIIKKTLKEIRRLEKKAYNPSITNAADDEVEFEVEPSDEQNLSYENTDIFTAFNQSSEVNSLKVDVKIDEDNVEEGDNVNEDGKDTVFGQGSNPNPKDETYLGLLKKSRPMPKVKVKVKK
jgi:hypothetical protein